MISTTWPWWRYFKRPLRKFSNANCADSTVLISPAPLVPPICAVISTWGSARGSLTSCDAAWSESFSMTRTRQQPWRGVLKTLPVSMVLRRPTLIKVASKAQECLGLSKTCIAYWVRVVSGWALVDRAPIEPSNSFDSNLHILYISSKFDRTFLVRFNEYSTNPRGFIKYLLLSSFFTISSFNLLLTWLLSYLTRDCSHVLLIFCLFLFFSPYLYVI
jgi:hypothetical protein